MQPLIVTNKLTVLAGGQGWGWRGFLPPGEPRVPTPPAPQNKGPLPAGSVSEHDLIPQTCRAAIRLKQNIYCCSIGGRRRAQGGARPRPPASTGRPGSVGPASRATRGRPEGTPKGFGCPALLLSHRWCRKSLPRGAAKSAFPQSSSWRPEAAIPPQHDLQGLGKDKTGPSLLQAGPFLPDPSLIPA